jgi:hypothetical protein
LAIPGDHRAILRIHDRAAASCNDEMAGGNLVQEDLPLDGAKIRLAVPGKNRRDGLALALLDHLVHID